MSLPMAPLAVTDSGWAGVRARACVRIGSVVVDVLTLTQLQRAVPATCSDASGVRSKRSCGRDHRRIARVGPVGPSWDRERVRGVRAGRALLGLPRGGGLLRADGNRSALLARSARRSRVFEHVEI